MRRPNQTVFSNRKPDPILQQSLEDCCLHEGSASVNEITQPLAREILLKILKLDCSGSPDPLGRENSAQRSGLYLLRRCFAILVL